MPARRGCAEGSELVLQTGFEEALPYTSTIAACARKFECDLAKVEHPERYRNAAPISPVGSGERVRLISAREPPDERQRQGSEPWTGIVPIAGRAGALVSLISCATVGSTLHSRNHMPSERLEPMSLE